jgi:hypothetical protein
LQEIRDAINKRPFKAFTISLADGRSFFVPHPELVAVGKRRIIVVKPDDSWSEVEPLLIVSLDYNGNHSKPTRRGKRRK